MSYLIRSFVILGVALGLLSTPWLCAGSDGSLPPGASEAGERAGKVSKRKTYPLYAKVVSITAERLVVVRSDKEGAKQTLFMLTPETKFVKGDEMVTIQAVRPGLWIGGSIQKAEDAGADKILKINIGVKQRVSG